MRSRRTPRHWKPRRVPSDLPLNPNRSLVELAETVLTHALAPALSALIGAAFGARFALNRFKEERAHTLRVEWYLAALRTINRLNHTRRRNRASGEAQKEFAEARDDFSRMVAEAPAFMGRTAGRKLRMLRFKFLEAASATHEAMVDEEESDLILSFLAYESTPLDDAADLVLTAFHDLVPPGPTGPKASWWERLKARSPWKRS